MEVIDADARVNLRQALLGIAQAIDAVELEAPYHGYHVAYIAYRCAVFMGWDEEQAQLAFSIGLLHDCGGAQSRNLLPLFPQCLTGSFSRHCEKGYTFLKECQPLSCFATPVLYHHTMWQELKDLNISETDKQLSAIIFLANRFDHLVRKSRKDAFGNLFPESKQKICEELQGQAGNVFEPNMVENLTQLASRDDFWFAMKPNYIEQMYFDMQPVPFFSGRIGLEGTIAIAEFFAKIVDAKSSFTFQHSLKVAELAQFIAKDLGYSPKTQRMLYLAGLIHDIGKLHTPDSILHKPGKLTDEEYNCIKRHATDTRFLLQNVFCSQQVLEWASNHHERLDGSGYPLGKFAYQLDRPSRIIAVSDVFQALTQSRPYRPGMPLYQALEIVRGLVDSNQLDREIFGCLERNAHYCYKLSIGDDADDAQRVQGLTVGENYH